MALTTKTYVERLEALGYRVEEAMTGVLFLGGYGVTSYFPFDDTDTLDSMIDPDLHKARVDALEKGEP